MALSFLQTDERLPTVFYLNGCHLLVLGGMVQTVTGVEVTPADATWVYAEALASQFVRVDCHVDGPDGVLRLYLRRIGKRREVAIYQVGADGQFWGWVRAKDYQCVALKGRTPRGNFHFREGDASGLQIYDPSPGTPVDLEVSRIYYQVREV